MNKGLFSLNNYRLRQINKVVKQINGLARKMRRLSDQELQGKTAEFKERLARGESLDSILPEAYAVVREADHRVLGMFPYDVQVMGGIVLHQGNVAEMKTGEGKTLTATMPLYLNALTGKGALLVTPNGYLAKRDFEEMSPVYRFLGLTVSVGVFDEDKNAKKIGPKEKRELYAADIHYTTNGTLGFDYLIDNLASSEDGKFMRPFHYAVLDEVDAVLLDTAQTPLIISGAPRVQSNLYELVDHFVTCLEVDETYYFDKERQEIWFKQAGLDEMERYFGLKNIFDPQHMELLRHLTLALKAHHTMYAGKDYLVEEEQVKLLDKTNGRTLEGTKLQGGFHQALEAKEKVEITEEMRAVASITYQNLFLMFEKLSGMTGTGKTAEDELIDTYNMAVVQVPTHRPVIRRDLPDKIYTTLPEKILASIQKVKEVHATGQPILLVTGSVTMSELYSELLLREGIPHNLLNAFNAAKEAQMISEAGKLGNVTVATNMAGRGTDIKLPKEVKELGGLAVICTERMSSKRMDLQVKGRSGRQGEPGFSQCFVSLEDDLMVQYGGPLVQAYFKKHHDKVDVDRPKELSRRRFHRWVQRAQEASEGQGRAARSQTLQFDESVKVQRELIYQERDRLIAGLESRFDVMELLSQAMDEFFEDHPRVDEHQIERFIFENISYFFDGELPKSDNQEVIKAFLMDLLAKGLEEKKQLLRTEEEFISFVRIAVLKGIDEAWVEEVDYLQQLRTVVAGRSIAQRNPIYEYHKEALLSFKRMKKEMRSLIVRNLMLSDISYTPKGSLEIYFS